MEQQYSCSNCKETYGIHDGIFCNNTTPFYQLTNCSLTIEELIHMAHEYDKKHRVDESGKIIEIVEAVAGEEKKAEEDIKSFGEIEFEVPYTNKSERTNREELCSVLATKLRNNAIILSHVPPYI